MFADLDIAGVRIRLTFASQSAQDSLLPALAHRVISDAEPSVSLVAGDRASVPPPRETPSTRVSYFAPSGSLSVYDPDSRRGTFTVRDPSALPSYERAAPLRTLLYWALEPGGCTFAHAAAVATSAGGVLLAGRGGSGKSTTALLCARAGFRFAGDDYVGITVRDAAVEAHSLFCTAKFDTMSLSFLPFLRAMPLIEPRDGEKGVAFLADAARSFAIQAIVVPRVTGGVSRLRPASRAAALRALAPTTLFQLPGQTEEAFSAMAAIARRLPAWSLELGDDRERLPSLVAQAIEESR